MNVAPAMVTVPVRLAATGFAATLKPPCRSRPGRPTGNGDPGVIAGRVHEQPVATVTPLLPVPPDAANDWLVGVMDGEHEAGA